MPSDRRGLRGGADAARHGIVNQNREPLPGTLLTPDDNIHYAGEHLSILQGWQEGAILSAYHAIDQIVAKDSA